MNVQWLLVLVVVALCSVHATWSLMPAAARALLAASLLRLPLPRRLSERLQRAARRSAKACGGCDACGEAGADTPAASAARPITIHRRPPQQ